MIPEGASLKRTPLYQTQAALHARFGSFGGWELPVSYTSILQEHQVVRGRVGLFDVSHLGHMEVSGPQALAGLEPLVTQDLRRLEVGRACYTPMLNERGGILDEMIVYRMEAERFRLVVNAANGDKDLNWFRERLDSGSRVEDLRERVGTLALQGPQAVTVLAQVSQDPFAQLPRYGFQAGKVAGRPAGIARTGYTGEDGFELFLTTEDMGWVWEALLEVGRPLGIQPIGLGARDTLRLEAGMRLYGNDLDETTTPLEADMEWTVAWEKGPFVGREVLERQRREGLSRKLIGLVLKGPGVPRAGYPLLHTGPGPSERRGVGRVTSGTLSPTLQKPIAIGYAVPEAAQPGGLLEVEIHGRAVPAEVVRLPFYRRRDG
jgi:aminomethyltransferase